MRYLVCTTLLLLACGSTPKHGDPIKPPPPSVKADAGARSQAATLTTEQCKALFEHMIDLKAAQQRAELPKEQHPSEADAAQVKEAVFASTALVQCSGSTPDAVQYECVMASRNVGELATCLGEE